MSHKKPTSLFQKITKRRKPAPRGVRQHALPPSQAPRTPKARPPEVTPSQSNFYAPNELHIDNALPPNVAILHIYPDGTDQYRLWGYSAQAGVLQDGPHHHPNLVLGEMVQSQRLPKVEVPQTIRDLMGEFSYSNLALRQWLKKLRDGKPYLLIADYTDFEIPWEMFEFSWNHYLGTTFATARWQHIIGDDDHRRLHAKAEICYGEVMAHVNRQELKGIGPEVTLLEGLNAFIHENIFDFRAQLEQHHLGIGLVYIATHGFFQRDIRQIAFGSQKQIKQRLSLLELRRRPLLLIKYSRTLIFLNTCHSGRLLMDKKRLRDQYQRGFAELFLSKGARGVIATLGGVGDTYAAHFAKTLLEKVLQQPNTPVAELLRQIRAEVVANLSDEPNDEQLLTFIYTFMYVYYGNPMTTLQLSKREE